MVFLVPAFLSDEAVSVNEGQALLHHVFATNGPNTLEVLGNLPTGIMFNTFTGELRGLASTTAAGIYVLNFKATNEHGVAEQQFILTVGDVDDVAPPTAPGNLHATEVTTMGAKLNWDPPTDESYIKGFRIYKDGSIYSHYSYTPTAGFLPTSIYVGRYSSPQIGFQGVALPAGSTSLWKVMCIDAFNNESPFSNEISVTQLS